MQHMDDRPIWREFKDWVWKNYYAHLLHFMVNAILECALYSQDSKELQNLSRDNS